MFKHSGRKIALLIGNTYKNNSEWVNIPSDKDVEKFSELLSSLNFKVTSKIDVKIIPTLKKFLKTCKEDDLILIYFSGHGEKPCTSMHLPREIGLCSTWINPKGTSVFSYWIDKLLSDVDFKCKLILLSDSCHSGQFLEYYYGINHIQFIGSSSSMTKSFNHTIKNKKYGALTHLFTYLIDIYSDNVIFNQILEDSKEFRYKHKFLYYMCLKEIK